MPANPSPPDFAHRLGVILAGLAALIARCFLRDPFHAPLIVPLWTHLTRAARRLERAFARLAASLPAPKPRRAHASGPYRRPVLPTRPAWLIRALGPEAAAYASQMRSLLAEPEAADALTRSLAARRILAPIRRMLGLATPRRRQPRAHVPAPPPPPPAPAVLRPTPPPWLRDPPPARTARPWWLPPRRLRTG